MVYPTRNTGTLRLSTMFLETAFCMVENGTVFPETSDNDFPAGEGEGAAAVVILGSTDGFPGSGFASSGFAEEEDGVPGSGFPAAVATSAAVIRPNGPEPTTESTFTLYCFASFFA